jgi:hypothetical protein
MPFTYTLRTPDLDNVGQIELNQPATTGEEIWASGRRMLIQAVVPSPPVEEFLDSPCVGYVVVEPVE